MTFSAEFVDNIVVICERLYGIPALFIARQKFSPIAACIAFNEFQTVRHFGVWISPSRCTFYIKIDSILIFIDNFYPCISTLTS